MKRLRCVFAYGNELRGDDGAAWELARRAEKRGWNTRCVLQLLPELVEELKDLDEVIFVDAAEATGPAQCCRLPPHNPVGWPVHCGHPGQLLALCQQLHGRAPRAWMLTLPGREFGYRLELSLFSQSSVEQGLEHLRQHFPDQVRRRRPGKPVAAR